MSQFMIEYRMKIIDTSINYDIGKITNNFHQTHYGKLWRQFGF